MADEPGDTPPGLALGPLGESLGFLLRRAQLHAFESFYGSFGARGLRPGAHSVLQLIGENPGVRQGVLARALLIKRAHMTKLVKAMEAEGLIRRTVPDDDRRAFQLWLSDKGAARLADLSAPLAEFEARPGGGLTPEETSELKALLKKYIGQPTEGEDR